MDKAKKNILELTRITRDDYLRLRKLPLSVMADNVRSAQNIGAVLRTSDALLVREVIMGGISAVPPSPEISKTALGAEESVSWRYVSDPYKEAIRLQQEEGVKIMVLEQTHNSVMLQDLSLPEDREGESSRQYLLVIGNEVNGVDQRIVDIADYVIEIPMHGIKHSLNVAVSTGMTLWQLYTILYPRLSR